MAIIRITKKQIQAANRAREAALKKDDDFRRYETERRQRLDQAARTHEAAWKKELNAVVANEEQPS